MGRKKKDKYKSDLERSCAKLLKEHGLWFKYEPITFTIVEKFKFESEGLEKNGRGKWVTPSANIRAIKYTPDFIGKNWIIETKGRVYPQFPMRWKLFKKYMMDNDLHKKYPLVFMPSNQKQILECIKMIKEYSISAIGFVGTGEEIPFEYGFEMLYK